MKHVLLTGATGLLGEYLLRDLLERDVPVAVLGRSRAGDSVTTRVERLLARWEESRGRHLPRPVCLEGDLTTPGLGLDAESRRWITSHCGSVLHNAASLTFVGSDRAREPWLTNRTGTSYLLDLCRRAGLRDLHYVSTAYVCGTRQGTVIEAELDQGQGFRNDYEASKFEAEKLVRAATWLERLTVYRPAVIVGDSTTGYTATYHGLYQYLYFAWLLGQYSPRDTEGRWHAPVRLNLTGDERRNLVPVDWVSAVMVHIFTEPRRHGRTYHLTPPEPVTAREIEEAMGHGFAYYGPTFAGPDGLEGAELNDVERLFYEHVSRYAGYWTSEPMFDAANTHAAAPHFPCPRVDVPLIQRLITYAVQDGWGKGRR